MILEKIRLLYLDTPLDSSELWVPTSGHRVRHKYIITGVYQIKNEVNGKCYIGSTEDISYRLMSHKQRLRKLKGDNRLLQEEFNIYGETSFSFKAIEVCETRNLKEREQFWIIKSESHPLGYNLVSDTQSMKGYSHCEESRAKMSAGQRKRFSNPEEIAKSSRKAIEFLKKPEVREKISKSITEHHKCPVYREERSKQIKEQRKQNPDMDRERSLRLWKTPEYRERMLTRLMAYNKSRRK